MQNSKCRATKERKESFKSDLFAAVEEANSRQEERDTNLVRLAEMLTDADVLQIMLPHHHVARGGTRAKLRSRFTAVHVQGLHPDYCTCALATKPYLCSAHA
jgi:hypothetical protein